jgi:hypothetical protein
MDIKENSLIPITSIEKVKSAISFLADCESVVSVEIKTADQYIQANDLFKKLNANIKDVEAERETVKRPYFLKGKDIDAWFKDPQSAMLNMKSKLDGAIRAYNKIVEDKRREEQARLDREAEDKRKKQEEAARIEREKADQLRRDAENAKNEEERQKMLAQAQKAESKAELKEQKAENIVAPIAQAYVPAVKGMSTRQNWKFECTDPVQFVGWAIENKMWNLVEPNQATCNAYAKSMRIEKTVPGGRFFNDESLTSRK